MQNFNILVINPGSTSTKISFFQNEKSIAHKTVSHTKKVTHEYKRTVDQLSLRLNIVRQFIQENNLHTYGLSAVSFRGGMLKPLTGGVYELNDLMLSDLESARYGEHASNLGGLIGKIIAQDNNCKAYTVDPIVVDELDPVSRISGLQEIPRISIFHALNQKAMARKYASEHGKKYEEINLIVAHLGGGISVGLHKNGKVIDVNNCLVGDGPLSPNRSGSVPVGGLVNMCFSGTYNRDEIIEKISKKGGLTDYLDTSDVIEIENRIKQGDKDALLSYKAMITQTAKEIGGLSTILNGKIETIILTGGLAHSQNLIDQISDRVRFIAPITIYPGEMEMEALNEGVLRVLRGNEHPKEYV